jgi:hypothetical protein
MNEDSGANKNSYIIDGQNLTVFSKGIDELRETSPILLSDNQHAIEIRKGFRAMMKPEGEFFRIGLFKGDVFWIGFLKCELEHHFKKKTIKTRLHNWGEMSKGVKRDHHKSISKQISKLNESLGKLRMEEHQLMLSGIFSKDFDGDVHIAEVLTKLDSHIRQLAYSRGELENYIDSEIRASKPGALPIDVRLFIKVIARQLVNSFRLDYTPNKLIASITNLKYENFYDYPVVVSDKDVENLTANQNFNSEYETTPDKAPQKT